jgi:putative DNA primase/helicase
MFGNHKPNIRGADEGIWSRVKMIPFEVTISLGEHDPKLKSKLIAHELSGILALFVKECCVEHAAAEVTSSDLYSAYKEWAGSEAMNKVEFGKRLREKGYRPGRGGKGIRTWEGIGLIDETRASTPEAKQQ